MLSTYFRQFFYGSHFHNFPTLRAISRKWKNVSNFRKFLSSSSSYFQSFASSSYFPIFLTFLFSDSPIFQIIKTIFLFSYGPLFNIVSHLHDSVRHFPIFAIFRFSDFPIFLICPTFQISQQYISYLSHFPTDLKDMSLCIRYILYSVKKCGSFLPPQKSAGPGAQHVVVNTRQNKVYNIRGIAKIGSCYILGVPQGHSILCATVAFLALLFTMSLSLSWDFSRPFPRLPNFCPYFGKKSKYTFLLIPSQQVALSNGFLI